MAIFSTLLESLPALRAHFRAALRRWQNCLVFNGAECFQLFLGGESLGCDGLLESEHWCFRGLIVEFYSPFVPISVTIPKAFLVGYS